MSARWEEGNGMQSSLQSSRYGAANDDSFISRMAGHRGGGGGRDPVQLRVHYSADIGEVLSVVEDLWVRIARHSAVRSTVLMDAATGGQLVLFRFDADSRDAEICQLLAEACACESYWWRQDGVKGSLVSDIQWAGSTLVVELVSLNKMQRWPDGDAVQWAVQSLLNRLDRQGRCA